jgi:hypothetical protein
LVKTSVPLVEPGHRARVGEEGAKRLVVDSLSRLPAFDRGVLLRLDQLHEAPGAFSIEPQDRVQVLLAAELRTCSISIWRIAPAWRATWNLTCLRPARVAGNGNPNRATGRWPEIWPD